MLLGLAVELVGWGVRAPKIYGTACGHVPVPGVASSKNPSRLPVIFDLFMIQLRYATVIYNNIYIYIIYIYTRIYIYIRIHIYAPSFTKKNTCFTVLLCFTTTLKQQWIRQSDQNFWFFGRSLLLIPLPFLCKKEYPLVNWHRPWQIGFGRLVSI